MEEINKKKYILEFGAWTGIALVSFAIMLFILEAHYDNSTSVQMINGLIQLFGVTIACLSFKKANSNKISWEETRKIGTGVSLIIALIIVIYTYFLINIIDVDYIYKSTEIRYYQDLEKYPEYLANVGLNEYVENAKQLAWVMYPFILFITIIFGFLYSVILGLFIKTKNES